MPYSTQLLVLLASLPLAKRVEKLRSNAAGAASAADLREVIEPALEKLCRLVEECRGQRVTPTQALCFEQQL